MKIDILTLFPKMLAGPFDESIIKRAREKGIVKISIHDLRKWAKDKHKTVDDRPYGGGVGMVLMVEPISKALMDLKTPGFKTEKTILLTPRGKVFNQKRARQLAKLDHLILIAGHYEGYDERISKLVDQEISVGDYILTGGELPAMVVVDSIVRLIPGVLVKKEAIVNESFTQNLLEYPQYTRPEKFRSWRVPKILLSGNHKKITQWRENKALAKTKKVRPDIITLS